MTNLEWIIKQNLKDLIQDVGATAINIYLGQATKDEIEKCQAVQWLFRQRKEEECITSKKSEQEQTKN